MTMGRLRARRLAVAIRGDRLVAVGSNADADAHRARHARLVDLGGRSVTPGFIDDHTHFNQAGALLIGADLLDVSTPAPFTERVQDAVARMSPGAWLTGGDWSAYEDRVASGTGSDRASRAPRFSPDRTLIDAVSGETPVPLNRWDRSAWLANGLALKQAGLSCDRPVEGLECVAGAATGRVSGAALARVRATVAPKTFDQRLREAWAAGGATAPTRRPPTARAPA
jgi:predicted amidohydrolase YtcJ